MTLSHFSSINLVLIKKPDRLVDRFDLVDQVADTKIQKTFETFQDKLSLHLIANID